MPSERPKSILKKAETPHSHHEEINSLAQKSVKFKKSKDVEQARLRTKLNVWLEAKGKTPSRCRHLICFDEDLSAKKKRNSVLQGRLSQDILGKQIKALEREETQNVKKKLFKEDRVIKRENSAQGTPMKRVSETKYGLKKKEESKRSLVYKQQCGKSAGVKTLNNRTNTPKSPRPSMTKSQPESKSPTEKRGTPQTADPPSSPAPNIPPQITENDIQENLRSMLDECLTLLRAGCPAENILPWLHNMELYIPQTHTSALFYACKAEVFAHSPLQMLEIFCLGIERKAEPSDVLSNAMRLLLTPYLENQRPQPPEVLAVPHTPSTVQQLFDSEPDCEVDDIDADPNNTDKSSGGKLEGLAETPVSRSIKENNLISPDHPEATSSLPGTSLLKRKNPDSDIANSQEGHSYTALRTPREKINNNTVSQLGSTIKYTVSTVTPIPGQSPELVPKSMLTPVRRSTRLSNRLPTPQLVHEINSVSDLTLREVESTLYQPNPAIPDH